MVGRTLRGNAVDAKSGKVIAKEGTEISDKIVKDLAKAKDPIAIVPWVSDDVNYLTADEEDRWTIAQANAPLTEKKEFVRQRGVVPPSRRFSVQPHRGH